MKSYVANYSNYSNKRHIGEFNMRRGAYSRKYGTKRCAIVNLRSLEKRSNQLKY